MTRLIEFLSGKWVFPVLFHLSEADRAMRFGELQRALGRITQRELSRTLRELERQEFVTRHVYAEVPPRVEYAITELGISLRPPLAALAEWAIQHRELFEADKLGDCSS